VFFGVLRTGAPWHDLPRRYPPYQTCHRRFQQWRRSGLLTRLLLKLAEDLRDRGKLDLRESFIDASFSSAKKGALLSALLAAAKAAKIMTISDGHGLPLAVHVASASPHETKLVEPRSSDASLRKLLRV
jgi:transposase